MWLLGSPFPSISLPLAHGHPWPPLLLRESQAVSWFWRLALCFSREVLLMWLMLASHGAVVKPRGLRLAFSCSIGALAWSLPIWECLDLSPDSWFRSNGESCLLGRLISKPTASRENSDPEWWVLSYLYRIGGTSAPIRTGDVRIGRLLCLLAAH
jgi:hypothetical protein